MSAQGIESRIQNLEFRRLKLEARSLRSKNLLAIVNCLISNGTGFTLIELLVSLTIVSTLILGVLLAFNPVQQINKGQDARRISDLEEIKTALDLYYHDHNCYPTQAQGIPFGASWNGDTQNTIYMKKVPQDPRHSSGEMGYQYLTDSSSPCPQWGVVFAQLSPNSSTINACAISSLTSQNCKPPGYDTSKWACTMMGAVNCDKLASSAFVPGTQETVIPYSTAAPTATPVVSNPTTAPTPTDTPGTATYTTLDSNQDPDAFEVKIMPLYQSVGQGQSIQVKADDTKGNINSVKVVLYSDGDAQEFTLDRTGGTNQNGIWSGVWQVTDTYNQIPEKRYGYDIIVTDSVGGVDTDMIRINRP